ncbi:Panacea domain-containing protein [Geminocystis sp. NIES-3709]|uniref:Panacea domain-containing protein n=1 Tax=Geminocystis sp. NIES-3709 TaxID=1617448 RepID=UPI0005FC4720|nr:type II toxin-antitoxin system antitoxin SocA domain-containing protein [Geminocystis sp. NIES-3709]BAQ63773.1 putative prophage protein [Geminocystis sp. NIES-3709]
MVSPLTVAKYFIIRAYEDGRDDQMTNMKLQKLLYYSQCLYLALFDEPLFLEDIQAWRYGPVCPPAYHFYSEFEAQQLPIPTPEYINEELKAVLEEVWQYFGQYHAYYLSDLTHLEFPWKKARKDLPSYASSNESISIEDMKLLGQKKLLEIEQNHPHYEQIISHILKGEINSHKKYKPQYIKQGEVNEWLNSLLA